MNISQWSLECGLWHIRWTFLSGRRRLLAVAGAAAVVQSIAPAARAEEVPAGLVRAP